VEKAADKVVVDEDAAKCSSDPAVEAGKEIAACGAQVKEVVKATVFLPIQSPTAEVIDGDDKATSFMTAASFPLEPLGSMTLIHQLEGVI
jgi:hypothetical protein